jgi:hypothetical protein
MKPLEPSKLWRTIIQYGDIVFGVVLASVGILLAADPALAMPLRIVAASALILAGVACIVSSVLLSRKDANHEPIASFRSPSFSPERSRHESRSPHSELAE